MFEVIFFCEKLLSRNAGKIEKIRTRKSFIPHGMSSLSKFCLFCCQPVAVLVAIFRKTIKKIVPLVGEQLQRI